MFELKEFEEDEEDNLCDSDQESPRKIEANYSDDEDDNEILSKIHWNILGVLNHSL
jgi:hypothetical protein